ncbi:polyglutamine binding protein 1 [Echinococcus multilocularis]|uniref:Polyglutamine-binding protein 1 n=1 Tax=Echinococcus multilocularis TaxID=6211 RepID=A0A068Y6Q4_ECHMU|nr:polyglutamine binding protein 1 [Echinococcus multilocularis]
MPLPPALAARLAKRGLLDKSKNEEEVFAESYDGDGSGQIPPILKGISPVPIIENGTLIHEIAACPNLTNPYHECTAYCFERYGRRTFRASDQHMGRLRDRMLRRYPLPSHWLEVGDPVTGRFYYWNTVTDEVCWLSPLHPRAIITKSASVLKAQTLAAKAAAAAASAAALAAGGLDGEFEIEKREGKRDRSRSPTPPPPPPPATSQSPLLTNIMPPPSAPPPSYVRLGNSMRRAPKFEKRRRSGDGDEPLDPMDPAAYSDVPRGGWTAGLEGVSGSAPSAKTGADVTASGPLFQQRPYPSPGDVLRANMRQRQD